MIEVSLRERAMNFLAKREHSRQELRIKLSRYAFDEADIELTLSELSQDNLQSDERFVDDYIRSKQRSGYGVHYIQQQLNQRGIDAALTKRALSAFDEWQDILKAVWDKKYGDRCLSMDETVKAQRFLLSRGFDIADVRSIIDDHK